MAQESTGARANPEGQKATFSPLIQEKKTMATRKDKFVPHLHLRKL